LRYGVAREKHRLICSIVFGHATLRQKLLLWSKKYLQIVDFCLPICYDGEVKEKRPRRCGNTPRPGPQGASPMARISLPRRTRPVRTTHHHRCDYFFLDLLEQDFGISQFSLRSAFIGVPSAPKRQAIALCELAINAAGGDPEEAGDLLRAWAKKQGVGSYNPRLIEAPELTWEHTAHERAVREGRLPSEDHR
jgi:hypothetical protein